MLDAMSHNLDPEGNVSVLGDTSAITVIIPPEQTVLLYASFEGAWEQAAVLYLNGERFENQLGSFVLRSNSLSIPPQPAQYELTLVGWHKRSNANPDLPWIASRGRRIGPVVFAWDDSAEDEDYRDMRIKLLTS
jgi:hypothetical protein